LFAELKTVTEKLERLDIFQETSIALDVPKDPLANSSSLDIIIFVKEKSRLKAETGTYFGNQEGNLVNFKIF